MSVFSSDTYLKKTYESLSDSYEEAKDHIVTTSSEKSTELLNNIKQNTSNLMPDIIKDIYNIGVDLFGMFVSILDILFQFLAVFFYFISEPYMTLLLYEIGAMGYATIKTRKSRNIGFDRLFIFIQAQIWLLIILSDLAFKLGTLAIQSIDAFLRKIPLIK